MELQYTMTEKDLRNQFLALGRTKGSLAYRQMRSARRLAVTVILITLALYVVYMAVEDAGANQSLAITLLLGALMLVPLTVLIAPVAAIFWALVPRLMVVRQMRRLRPALPGLTTQPYTLRLEGNRLTYAGPGAVGGQGQFTCPAAELRAIRPDPTGLVLVFADGSGLLAPMSAFAAMDQVGAWGRALQQATAVPAPAREDPSATLPDGFVADGAGGGTFACTLTNSELPSLLWQATAAWLRTGSCWRRYWSLVVYLLLLFAYSWWVFNIVMAVCLTGMLTVVAVLFVKKSIRSQAWMRSGRFAVRFDPETMHCTDAAGRTMDLPYRAFPLLLQTPDLIALYAPASGALRLFPRRVLTPESEAALLALLRSRLNKAA